MLPFSTEFPVIANQNRAAFLAEVIAWLRGNKASTVLSGGSEKELEGENAHIISTTGEELRIREIRENEKRVALGFRHDLPDADGRIWRTDGVLKAQGAGKHDLLRLRAHCRAARPGVKLEIPKKTYLIKALLKGGWGASDGEVQVSDEPIWLHDDERGIALASKVTNGDFARWLPVIYVSATDSGRWALSTNEIEKLAFDLGGMAHVVVEPSRRFSFELRDASGGRNVYSGAVGISVPGHGIVGRAFNAWHTPDSFVLLKELQRLVGIHRERMPVFGWDWSDLQELSLRKQRSGINQKSKPDDVDELFDELVKQLDEVKSERAMLAEQNGELKERLVAGSADGAIERAVRANFEELYPSEFWDRVRYAAQLCLDNAEVVGLDDRSIAMFTLLSKGQPSPTSKN